MKKLDNGNLYTRDEFRERVENGLFIAEYKSLTEASKQTGINISCISNNIAGRTKRAGNFHWKYN